MPVENISLKELADLAASYRATFNQHVRALTEFVRAADDARKKADRGDAIFVRLDGTEGPWPVETAVICRLAEAEDELKTARANLRRCSELIELGACRHRLRAETKPLTLVRMADNPTEQQITDANTAAELVRIEATGLMHATQESTLAAGREPDEMREPLKKRTTEKGEARNKIIAALATHHQYDNGSVLNFEPIGLNKLVRLAEVGSGTVSEFFNREFNEGGKRGHAKYQIACRERGRLVDYLRVLLGEYPPSQLFKRLSDEQLKQLKAADD